MQDAVKQGTTLYYHGKEQLTYAENREQTCDVAETTSKSAAQRGEDLCMALSQYLALFTILPCQAIDTSMHFDGDDRREVIHYASFRTGCLKMHYKKIGNAWC